MNEEKNFFNQLKVLIDLNNIDRLNTIVNMHMADPALFPGFKVAWHVPSPSEGDVRERWVDSDTLAYIHVE